MVGAPIADSDSAQMVEFCIAALRAGFRDLNRSATLSRWRD
jgi:hypothetical protein